MGRNRKLGYERQDQGFYATPDRPKEAVLRRVRMPNGIWEPCCGNGAMAQVLAAHGHRVVATDLMDRGYGEGGRDFMLETRLPDGVTAIVTNPPYAPLGRGTLYRLVDHVLELLLPVGGMLALLVNSQWPTSKGSSARCSIPAYQGALYLTDRIRWFDGPDNPQENHCWVVWDHSRRRHLPWQLFTGMNPESDARKCFVCPTPIPSTARADRLTCSDACRQTLHRRGLAQRPTA